MIHVYQLTHAHTYKKDPGFITQLSLHLEGRNDVAFSVQDALHLVRKRPEVVDDLADIGPPPPYSERADEMESIALYQAEDGFPVMLDATEPRSFREVHTELLGWFLAAYQTYGVGRGSLAKKHELEPKAERPLLWAAAISCVVSISVLSFRAVQLWL